MSSHEPYSLDELARQLGRDRREIEKLVNRGRIPGRKVAGEWQFHPAEITQWLEREMREFTDRELAQFERSQQSDEPETELALSSLITPELVEVPLQAKTKRSVLESLVEVAGRTWQVWEPATVLSAVQAREEVMSTAFDCGVAIPHPRNPLPDVLGQPVVAFGRTFSGVPFGAPNGSLTDLFFLVLTRDARTHLAILARLGRMIRDPEFLERLRTTDSATESYQLILACDAGLAD